MMAHRQNIANIVLIGCHTHKLVHNVNKICGRCNSKHGAACTRAVQYKAMAIVAKTKQMTTATTATPPTTTTASTTTTAAIEARVCCDYACGYRGTTVL